MFDVELRRSRSNFATCKIFEFQTSSEVKESEKRRERRKERKKETVLKEISMHTFV